MSAREVATLFAVTMIVTAAVFIAVPDAGAKGHGNGDKESGSAVIANAGGLRTADPDLSISQGDADGVPAAVEVRASSPGSHWVHLPVDLPSTIHSGKGKTHALFVTGVEVCHQELIDVLPLASFIDIVRLTTIEAPDAGEIAHEDETDFGNDTPGCDHSPVAFPFAVDGALTVSLKLTFAGVNDVFRLGAIRILLSTRRDPEPGTSSWPSGPSRPSELTEPTA
jgi:hypothetical protein